MTFTKHSLIIVGIGVAALAGFNATAFLGHGDAAKTASSSTDTAARAIVAGPGRIESASEEVQVSAQLGGKLRRVLADEGDPVVAGQIIAVLENDDYRARVALAEAELRAREADERRIQNGARAEERREAAAALREAETVFETVKSDQDRRMKLFADRVISREEMDHAEQQVHAAAARVDALREHARLVDANAREEDAARAASDVALAHAKLDDARATFEKTLVRAPIGGVVLRRHRKAGESVSTQFESPIVTLADRSVIRVRMDVDETDVGRVAVGQTAYITADAYGARRFPGRVIRVGQQLGKQNVRTDEPTERVDQKVLETLVALDDGHELPIGLRVQAFIVP
jgi:HlyD family secretion protein